MFDYEYWGSDSLPMKVNMALEEYFLKESAARKVSTVRFFNVPKDAVVLGYAQDVDAVKKMDGSFDLARRITGGSHIQFGPNCLDYSFTVPRDGSFSHYEDMRKYYAEKVANALVEIGVGNVDIDNRASTINVDGKVVASHAVFWGRDSALLHGLIIVDPYNVDRIFERVMLRERKIGNSVYTEYSALKNIPNISSLLEKETESISREFKTEYVKRMLTEELLRQVTEGKYKARKIDERALSEVRHIMARRLDREEWTRERNPPLKENEVEKIPGEVLEGPLKKNLGYCLYIQVKDKDFKRMAEPAE